MRLNIGLFNDSFPPTIDGVANTVVNYAYNIQKNHGTAIVATPKYPHVTDEYPFEVCRYSSVPIIGPLTYRLGNPISPLTIAELRQKQLDLIHVHSPFASSVLARQVTLPKRYRVPVVFTYHTKYEVDTAKFLPNKRLQKALLRFILHNVKLADEVWTVSQGAGESLREIGYRGDFRVMSNGTDFARGLAKEAEMAELHRIYNLQKEERVFLFVGRMMWYKNIKIIVDALCLLKRNGLRFRAFFIGDGNDRAAIERYAMECGLTKEAIFTGAIYDREKIRAYYSIADLFLFPSTYDTAGLVVKEAAACNCASLLVAGSCAAEGVVDEVSGLLAEENAESCAAKILAAARGDEVFEKLGENAARQVYLSWEAAVAKAYDRYEEIIRAWPRPLPGLNKNL